MNPEPPDLTANNWPALTPEQEAMIYRFFASRKSRSRDRAIVSPEQFPGVEAAVKSERERILNVLDGLMLVLPGDFAPDSYISARVDGWNDALKILRDALKTLK